MLRSFVILSLLCVLCFGSNRVGWPGYEFIPEIDGWLKVHEEPTTWTTARKNCHNEEALLVSPWTAAFAPAVRNLLTKYPSIPALYAGPGIKSDFQGIPLEPTANKRCWAFRTDGSIARVSCENQIPYACYAPSSNCDGGYEPNRQTGQCYKFHADASTVPRAREICKAEGGYLAKISNSIELTVLEGMSDGATYIENDDGGSEYRHLWTENGYSDYNCNGAHTFICEKDIVNNLRD